MREILFKAKTCNGEWVQGLLAHKDNKWYISNKAGQPFAFEVRPDTICQYTGLTDKNGNKIWENDIIKYITNENTEPIGTVIWDKAEFRITWKADRALRMDLFFWAEEREIKVIGNIFGNPELLKEGAE